jgi:gliding motility-associated-like protein
MNPSSRTQSKSLLAIVIGVFFSLAVSGQTRPSDNINFGVPGVGGPLASGVKMTSSVQSGLPFTFSFVSPIGTTGSVIYVGQPSSGGLFQPSSSAIFFNYTYSSGNVIPGAAAGTTGTGDYRLHFTQPNPSDTGANKLGNFGLASMYMAIGAGNTADINVYGFRAGKMVAQSVITGLSSNNGSLNSVSSVDLFYNGSDQYSGLTVSFGSNWQFLDGIRFEINDRTIPLSLNNIYFNDPNNISPGTQASAVNFTNKTGITSTINWTKGDGDRHVVFMKAAGSGATDIGQGVSYTANTTFGSGTTTADGWACVYNAMDNGLGGATRSVNVTNLTPGTTYRVMVMSYNGSGTYCTYNTNENQGGWINADNFTTVAIPTTQASNITVTPNYTDFRKASIDWTRGNGAKSAVFVKNNTPGQAISSTVAPPHNDNNNTQHTYSAFTDSLSVTANGRVGSTGWYCVYNNAGSGTGLPASVTMTRLTIEPNQTLSVMVIDYNGTAGAETYNTTTVSSNVIDYVVPNRPLPVTDAATGITTSTATMNGTITPRNGNITSGTFSYSNNSSLTPVLGTVAVTPNATTILGSALTATVSAALTALTPSTTYYYRLEAISNANTNAAATNKGSITASTLSFTTAPVVISVSATTANGYYKAGDVVTISVVFTAAVTVNGTPTIALNSGGSASYTSGSGSATLFFTYTIGGGQSNADLDYASVSALALAGGTIKDVDNNDASVVLPTPGGANSIGGQKDIVIDTQAPQVNTVAITSNNTNIALAKVGDMLTISFTSNETIVTPIAIIAGHAVTATNSGGNNWSAAYTMAGADAEGVVTFSIPFIDLAHNAGATVTGTTNSSSVRFDKTIPLLPAVIIASNNVNTALAKVGDVVAISFTSNETIFTPTATISGNAAVISNTGGNSWSASYTIGNGDAEGVIAFTVSFIDISGNAGATVTATNNGSGVRFDKTAPVLSLAAIASDNTNTLLAKAGSIIMVSFTSNETVFTPTATIASHTATVSNSGGNNWRASYTMVNGDAEGVIAFSVSFTDITGNTGVTVTATTNNSAVSFDKTIPLLPTVTIASNNTNTAISKPGDIVTVSFVASEQVFTPTVTIAGHTAAVNNTNGNNWTASYTMINADADGNIPFSVSFVDISGNAGATVAATTNSSVNRFDKTVPVLAPVTITSNNANNKYAKIGNTITLNFTGSETLQHPVVTVAGHTATVTSTGGNNWTASYIMASTDTIGKVTFSIAFKDMAGNNGVIVIATSNSSNVLFDSRLPLLTTVKIVSGNNVDSLAKTGDLVTLSFTSNKPIMVPVVTVAGHAAAITNVNGDNWIAATAMGSSDKEGFVPFAIAVTDLAGNAVLSITTTSDSSEVLFDRTAPTVVSIVRQSPLSGTVTAGTAPVIFHITFSEKVKNVTPAAFVLTTAGVTTASITSVSAGSGTAFDVTVNAIAGSGSIRLDLKNTGTNITDAAGNAISGGFTAGENYNVIVSPVSFATTAPALALCVGITTAVSLDNLLRAAGGDNGQTVIWTIVSNASHGTLNGFPAAATINAPATLPTGLTYLPANGYTGNDAFTIQVSNGYDSVTTVVNVLINALPVAVISSAQGTALCGAATLALTASGGTTYTWYNNGTLVPNAATSQFLVNAAGTYNAIATDAIGCIGSVGNSLVIEQFQKPTVDFAFDSYCINKGVTLTSKSVITNSGAVTYAWTDGTNIGAASSAVFTYAQTGAQSVKLTVTPVACPSLADNVTKILAIEAPVAALRMPTQNVAANTPVPLQARTAGAGNTYAWSPLTGLSAPNNSLTDAAISKEQQYLISITAVSGCVAVDTILLRIFVANTILVPNIFSPNGDGQNDKILPNLVGVKTFFYLRIFNRAGKKVFETHNPGEGWDGKLNGVPQPVDTYFWAASGTDKNGLPVNKQGTFTLIR